MCEITLVSPPPEANLAGFPSAAFVEQMVRVDREGPRERTVVGVSDPGSALGPVLQPPLSRALRPSATFASFDAGAGGSVMFRDPLGAPLTYSPWGRVRSPYIHPGYVYGQR